MSYRKHLMTSDEPPSELYKATEVGTNLAEVGTDVPDINVGELISRQAAIDALKAIKYGLWEIDIPSPTVPEYVEHHEQIKNMMEIVDGWIERIQEEPPIQPKRGKWIKTARWGRVYYCDQCRNYLDFDGVNAGRGSTNYCPNCGADMRGEQYG